MTLIFDDGKTISHRKAKKKIKKELRITSEYKDNNNRINITPQNTYISYYSFFGNTHRHYVVDIDYNGYLQYISVYSEKH